MEYEDGGSRKSCFEHREILPTEIIIDIFKLCLPTAATRREKPLHLLPPFTLSWTCKSWRRICLDSPCLWADVRLGHKGSDPEGDVRLLELFLERSAYSPISLQLTYEVDDAGNPVLFNGPRKEAYIDGMEHLIDVALSCIHRWRVFEVHALDIVGLRRLFSAIVIGAPRLERLSLSTKYLAFFGDFHMIDFSSCPNLQAVRLSSPMITPSSRSLTMRNLTTLDLRFCASIEDCMQWIDLCPNVEELTVRLFCTRPDFLGEEVGFDWNANGRCAGVRRLRRLKTLDIQGFSTEADLRPLLNIIEAPKLETFALNMYNLVDEAASTPILGFLRRSQPAMKSFKLSGIPMDENELVSCLRILPDLRTLIIGQKLDSILLQALTIPQTSTSTESRRSTRALCPLLAEINIVDASFSMKALEVMVSSRCSADPTSSSHEPSLKRLLVAPRVIIEVTGLPQIATSVENGLEIVRMEPNNLLDAFSSPDVVFV